MQGFINIYKPTGLSSSAVVGKIKKKFKISKIGHMGTLDPEACGILPLAIGKATRMFDYFLYKTKKYRAIFEFGYETNTLDLAGEIIKKSEIIPTLNQIQDILKKFIGNIKQVPPDYSAKHIGGFRAYDLARNGEKIKLKQCDVEIINIEILQQIDKTKFSFEIECGSGTYIRSLARDVAKELNTVATMIFLERVESGAFNLQNSIKLDKILEEENISEYLIPIEVAFPKFNKIDITSEEMTKLLNGLSLNLKENIKEPTLVFNNNKLIGVAEIGDKLRIKTFLKED